LCAQHARLSRRRARLHARPAAALGLHGPAPLFRVMLLQCLRMPAFARDCFCPFCPTAVVTAATATARERAYRRYCSTFRQSCPVPRCAAPPAAGCVNHACAFAPLR
jgi:hypothetical protein